MKKTIEKVLCDSCKGEIKGNARNYHGISWDSGCQEAPVVHAPPETPELADLCAFCYIKKLEGYVAKLKKTHQVKEEEE